jgi:microcystin-dependent protein
MTIPDLREKFIMGYRNGSRSGGANAQALTEANLPVHTHSLSNVTVSDNTHRHKLASNNNNDGGSAIGIRHASSISGQTSDAGLSYVDTGITDKTYVSDVTHSHTISAKIDSAGFGASFENRPEYYALIYIIKVTNAGE